MDFPHGSHGLWNGLFNVLRLVEIPTRIAYTLRCVAVCQRTHAIVPYWQIQQSLDIFHFVWEFPQTVQTVHKPFHKPFDPCGKIHKPYKPFTLGVIFKQTPPFSTVCTVCGFPRMDRTVCGTVCERFVRFVGIPTRILHLWYDLQAPRPS